MARAELEKVVSDLGLVVVSVFVPWSQSRSYKAGARVDEKNLNWKVTLRREYPTTGPDPIGLIDFRPRDVLTTDYSAGIAHCPYYKKHKQGTLRWSLYNEKFYEYEVELGHEACAGVNHTVQRRKPILPDPIDVIWSLVQDADVIDCGSFEEWAYNIGYDPDSRSAEATYRACLEIALKLRNAVGEEGLKRLREAGEDY